MAGRTLDKLMPQALALAGGVGALAIAGGGVAADFMVGKPGSGAALGIVAMFPLALFAAVVGFALGHYAGYLMRKARMTPPVSMKPYRLAMGLVLALVIVAGASIGATPVLRHERLHQPRILSGADRMERREGASDACAHQQAAPVVCELSPGRDSATLTWNARDVTISCTREGLIAVTDQSSAVVASLDLTAFEYMREAQASTVRAADGREGLVLLARLRTRRDMLAVFNADGQVTFQELLDVSARVERPLSICRAEDADSILVDAGSPITYRPR